MKISFVLLFSFIFLSSFTLAQINGAKSNMQETWTPISFGAEDAIFVDDMNGDNTVPGLNARGWFFDDVDGAGLTTTFQGNPAVFVAYEGPDTGYVGQNFNGAAGGGLLIDQWLISPEVTVAAGDTLKFWHRSPDGSAWLDPIQIWVSTTAGTTAADFDIQLDALTASITGWQQWVGNFPGTGTVRFAVRYYTTDGGPGGNESNYLGLDLFEVVSGISGPLCVFMDDFEAGLGNWVITNEGNIPCVWDTITLASRPPYTLPPEAVGLGMAADIDFCGSSGDSLYSTATMAAGIDATNYTVVTVEFDNDWRILDADDEAYFEMSVDGGTTWSVVASWIGVENRNTHEVHDVSSTAGLQADVRFRLRVIMPGWDWFWVVDNFAIYLDGFIPVELTSFTVEVNHKDVTLNWATATETNNKGFDIERNSGNGFDKISFVSGFGTTAESHNYSFVDESLPSGSYSYRLKQVDYDGSFEYSDAVEITVTVPDVYSLGQNYPNPFNPGTTIDFSLAVDSKVSLTVFDILGQEVANLLNSNLAAGQQSVQFDASSLNSGVYFYKLDAKGNDGTNFTSIKKMILIK